MLQLKRSHTLQLKSPHDATKIPRAATKTRLSQINKEILKKKKKGRNQTALQTVYLRMHVRTHTHLLRGP